MKIYKCTSGSALIRPLRSGLGWQRPRHKGETKHRSPSPSEADAVSAAKGEARHPNPYGTNDLSLIRIRNGTFYNEHPSSQISNELHPILKHFTFNLRAAPDAWNGDTKDVANESRHWAVIGTNPTPLLRILRGEYVAAHPHSRKYPYLSSRELSETSSRSRIPSQAIQYVGFNNGSAGSTGGAGGIRGAYLSARYESRKEETDWTVAQYLKGDTELNPAQSLPGSREDDALYAQVTKTMRLERLLDMPVSNLSNGQTRRSRIAQALLGKPDLLLLDEPFMGLDPPTLTALSPILRDFAYRASPLLLLGLRPQDPIPDWITHLIVLGEDNTVALKGSIAKVLYDMDLWQTDASQHTAVAPAQAATSKTMTNVHGTPPFNTARILSEKGIKAMSATSQYEKMRSSKGKEFVHRYRVSYKLQEKTDTNSVEHEVEGINSSSSVPNTQVDDQVSEPLIELSSIIVKYGDKVVLGYPPAQPGYRSPGLNLTISRGTRLLLLGPNGSGKTTLLSLLNSDHPQSYSLPIKFFGRTRLPSPGIRGLSLWEIQSRIGHSSPEVHAFFPKHFTVRQVLESAWAETFGSKPALDPKKTELVEHFLKIWQSELCQLPASSMSDSDLSWASDKENHPRFGRLSFGTQRLLLLLRAIIKKPDIIVLDEAFSGLSIHVRNKALAWLEKGDRANLTTGNTVLFDGLDDSQAIVVVSHVREEVPDCINQFIRLPSEEEAFDGKTVLLGPARDVKTEAGWNSIWNV